MVKAYPVVLSYCENDSVPYFVSVPDFERETQGHDLAEALHMARDLIGIMGMSLEDKGVVLPNPSDIRNIEHEDGDIVTLVDVDFAEYRRQNDMRTVRRNCSLPAWLDAEATKSKVNVSAVLQNALKQELHLA